MITSINNQDIKDIIRLQKNTRHRKKQGVFVVEGMRMFREIPDTHIVKVYTTEDFYNENRELFNNINYELVSENIYKLMSDTKTPQGVMAIVRMFEYSISSIINKESPLIIVLENLQDPGNLGTIIRTAEGAGIDGIIMSKDTVDIYNSKVVRATMGSIFRVPFVYSDNIIDTIENLKNNNINVFAAHLSGKSFYDEDYTNGSAFLIGNEGNGLSDEVSKRANKLIKIKMMGRVESLNAATAATVLMYEAMRQRNTI